MENAALFTPADVTVIRRYVQTKYAPLPDGKRAEIVAVAIRQTLERRLPDLPEELKTRIANELIRRCLLTEQRDIQPDDVLDACAKIPLPDPSSESIILDPVLRWMNERSPGQWSADKLLSRLFGRSPTPPDLGVVPFPELDPSAAQTAAASEAAMPVGTPLEEWSFKERLLAWKKRLASMPKSAVALTVLVLAGGIIAGIALNRQGAEPKALPLPPQAVVPKAVDIGMPEALRYRDIDAKPIKAYLQTRDAILAEEPYFSAIVASARKHDVNPLVLFAITGQEQGFVPKSNKDAKAIANNPFNVFHSWREYNTDIGDSSDIAARTIANLGRKRPEGHEPFSWFNKTYAEDPLWSNGVRKIYAQLDGLASGTK